MTSEIREFKVEEVLVPDATKVFTVEGDFLTLCHKQHFAAGWYYWMDTNGYELYAPTVNLAETQNNPVYKLLTTFKRKVVSA